MAGSRSRRGRCMVAAFCCHSIASGANLQCVQALSGKNVIQNSNHTRRVAETMKLLHRGLTARAAFGSASIKCMYLNNCRHTV